MAKPVVVITGVSGYVGAQVASVFLSDGSYKVRGTVRSTSNEAKLAPLRKAFGSLFDELELVEADLNNEQSIIDACAGAEFLVHTASPYNMEGGMVEVAVAGTMAAMKAATTHGIKRVVVTSSCAAIFACNSLAPLAEGVLFDETMWSNVDFLKSGALPQGLTDYVMSKTLAGQAAWDYQKENPTFELVTICPYFIYGPSLLNGNGESEETIKAVLKGKEKIPRGGQDIVDVRDVALMHLKAIQVEAAAGQRIMANNEYVSWKQCYDWMANVNAASESYPGTAKVPTELEDGEDAPQGDGWDNSKANTVLGVEYRSAQSTYVDMAQKFMEDGLMA